MTFPNTENTERSRRIANRNWWIPSGSLPSWAAASFVVQCRRQSRRIASSAVSTVASRSSASGTALCHAGGSPLVIA